MARSIPIWMMLEGRDRSDSKGDKVFRQFYGYRPVVNHSEDNHYFYIWSTSSCSISAVLVRNAMPSNEVDKIVCPILQENL